MKFDINLLKRRLPALIAIVTLLSFSPALAENDDSSRIDKKAFSSSDARMFKDKYYTGLKNGVTESQISRMSDPFLRQLAEAMKDGSYDFKSRIRSYEAYEPVSTLADRMKTSGYSQFENPTGIYFGEKDTAVMVVEGIGKEKVKLKVYNFGSEGTGAQHSYDLDNGLNIIKLDNKGLGYIEYYTPHFEKAPKVKIHILSGQVNGVFDSSVNTNEDWKKMLANAPCEVIDIVGKHVHLIYPVAEMKEYNPDNGLELINLYDGIINTQHEIMGLIKYKEQPKNRMLGRVIWKGFMHADGMGAAFHNNTMKEIGDPDRIPSNSWGIAHEFGHVNQVRPTIKWVSTTEVTNNLYSAWTNYLLDPDNMRLEKETINGGDGNVAGGRFNAYLNSAIISGEQWLCQKGPDKMEGYENGGDHFVKLGPLWQLQLYFMAAKRGNPEFLADVFYISRHSNDKGKSNGDFQLEFMKNVCDATKQDLTDFFVKTGMLKPINKELDDYTRGQLKITKADCDKLISYAKKYPKPDSPVVYYISVNSVDAYKNKLPVEGEFGKGIEVNNDGTLMIEHSDWKNVTVFETYKGKELIKIAMVGTGSNDNSFTIVQYPKDATKVEAVAWDGKRTLVYGK